MAEAPAGVVNAPKRSGLTPERVAAATTAATVRLSGSFAKALEERRLFVLLPFFVIFGLVGYRVLPSEPHPYSLLASGLALTAAFWPAWRHIGQVRILLLLLAFWAGFCLLPLQGALWGTKMLARPVFGTIEMRVDEILSEGKGEQRVVVSAMRSTDGKPAPDVRRARLFVRGGQPLAPGDVIEGPVRLAPVPGPVVAGGFDSQFHAYFDGIGAYGNTTGTGFSIRPPQNGDAARFISEMRRAIGLRIDAVLSQPASGIARALIMGDQSLVEADAREIMAIAGLAHALSISGLHLSIVAGGVYAAMRILFALLHGFAQRFAIKKLAALFGMATAFIYLAMSGASIPAVRSTIMLALIFGAVIAGRQALTMRNTAIAALVLVVADPASVFRPSFQLSFAAVVALIGVYELFRGGTEAKGSFFRAVFRFFGALALTSLIGGVATALFAAYHFQQMAPLGVLGNLAALPLVTFLVLPAGFAAVLMMPFGFDAPFLLVMGWGIERMLAIAGEVAALSSTLSTNPLLLPISLVFGLAALAWFAFLKDWIRFAGPVLALPLVLVFGLDRPPDVLVADTTKAVAVRSGEHLALVSGQIGSFAVNVWGETYGEEIGPAPGPALCDGEGCFAESTRGFRLALVTAQSAFEEDCRSADVVVTRLAAPDSCRALTEVIDAADLARGGTHWLGWNEDVTRFEIRPAIPDPERPWRPR